MNPEIKAKWIEALESGRYKKGKGYLRKEDEFCCLGVLCDIHDPSRWEQRKVEGSDATEWGYLNKNGPNCSYHMPPSNVDSCDYLHQKKLAELNDSTDDFAAVITYIKENL